MASPIDCSWPVRTFDVKDLERYMFVLQRTNIRVDTKIKRRKSALTVPQKENNFAALDSHAVSKAQQWEKAWAELFERPKNDSLSAFRNKIWKVSIWSETYLTRLLLKEKVIELPKAIINRLLQYAVWSIERTMVH